MRNAQSRASRLAGPLTALAVSVQDTAYVNPCYSENKSCGVPDYLGIDNVDETWCNCDLVDVCPVSRAS